jgi:hypothetical protein
MRPLFAALVGIFALTAPFLRVSWTSHDMDALTVQADGLKESIVECLTEGRQALVRFEVRLCRRRSGWLDRCETPRTELRTVEYDGITESYRVVSDRFGDLPEATAVGVPSRDEATRMVVTSDSFPLSFLERDEPGLVKNPKAYAAVRTIYRCKGSSTRTFAHLSRLLTFGLLNVVESVSDWHDFSLAPEDAVSPEQAAPVEELQEAQ